MGAAALPYIAGASVLGNFLQNKSAQDQANRARSGQQALTQRQIDLFDLMMKNANTGATKLDFGKQFAERKTAAERLGKQELNNLSASLQAQGYRPGDTPSTDAYAKSVNNYLTNLADTEQALKRQNVFDIQNLYSGVNASLLNPAIQQKQNEYQTAQSQQTNPFSGALSLIPYFPGMGK